MFKPDKNRNMLRSVMNQIKHDGIVLRPKSYFVVRKLILYFSLIFLLVACVYLASLVIFKIALYNPFGFLMFGLMGIHAFLLASPLVIMIFAILAFITTMVLLKNVKFVYRINLLSLVLGLSVFVSFSGSTLNSTGLNSYLRSTKKLPLLYHGQFVTEYGVTGKIIGVDETGKKMTIMTKNGDKITVEWNEKTKFPNGNSFKINDNIQAIGYLKGLLFQAKGIISTNL